MSVRSGQSAVITFATNRLVLAQHNARSGNGCRAIRASDDPADVRRLRGLRLHQNGEKEGKQRHQVCTILPAISLSSFAASTAVRFETSRRGLYSTMSAPMMGCSICWITLIT